LGYASVQIKRRHATRTIHRAIEESTISSYRGLGKRSVATALQLDQQQRFVFASIDHSQLTSCNLTCRVLAGTIPTASRVVAALAPKPSSQADIASTHPPPPEGYLELHNRSILASAAESSPIMQSSHGQLHQQQMSKHHQQQQQQQHLQQASYHPYHFAAQQQQALPHHPHQQPPSAEDLTLFTSLAAYADALDALPLDLTRSFSDLRELDAVLGGESKDPCFLPRQTCLI
jgi:hypothetical protein